MNKQPEWALRPERNATGRSKSAGFTLIELLVALLMSILLPALSRARMVALSIGCLSNLRQQGIAYQMYANDAREFGPVVSIVLPTGAYGPDYRRSTWMARLSPYLNGPEESQMSTVAGNANSVDVRVPVFQCPKTWTQGPFQSSRGHSYGVNVMAVSLHEWHNNTVPNQAYGPVRLTQIPRPGRFFLTGDCYIYTPVRGIHWKNTLESNDPTIAKSHDSQINWMFADGRAQGYRITQAMMQQEVTSGPMVVEMVVGKPGSTWANKMLGMNWPD